MMFTLLLFFRLTGQFGPIVPEGMWHIVIIIISICMHAHLGCNVLLALFSVYALCVRICGIIIVVNTIIVFYYNVKHLCTLTYVHSYHISSLCILILIVTIITIIIIIIYG